MEKNLVTMKPSYGEHILPVRWSFHKIEVSLYNSICKPILGTLQKFNLLGIIGIQQGFCLEAGGSMLHDVSLMRC